MFGKTRMVNAPADALVRQQLAWREKWLGPDEGLIACWEVGRCMQATHPEIAAAALRDELPLLAYKGGFGKKPKKMKHKYGTLHYLAMWRGLRAEELSICIDKEITLQCSRVGVAVTFTYDREKYLSNVDDEGNEDDEP